VLPFKQLTRSVFTIEEDVMLKKVIFTTAFVAVVAAAAWSANMVTSPEINPKDPIANAKALIEQGETDQALSTLQSALQSGSKSESVYELLGDLLLKKGDLTQAQQHFQEALKLNAQNPKAFVGLGIIDLKQQNVNGAIQKFTLAMKADPTSPEPYFQMGNLALGSGKPDVAMNFYRKALGVDPNHMPTQQVVAQMTAMMQKAVAAQEAKAAGQPS